MYTSQASLGGLFRHWYKVTDTEHLYKIKTPATLVGQTIKNIDFEENFGIHLVAIERPYEKKNLIGLTQTEYKVISRITEELMIEADDLLILFGKKMCIRDRYIGDTMEASPTPIPPRIR